MNWGGPEFVLGIIAIATLGGILKTWVRAQHGLPEHEHRGRRGRRATEDTAEVERLKAENARLTDRLEASEDRLAVLTGAGGNVRKKGEATSEQHRDHRHLHGIDESQLEEAAEELAATKQPDVFSG